MKSDWYMKASKKLYNFNKMLIRIEAIFLYILFLAIVAVIGIQVVSRYWLYIPTPWAEEFARFGCIWLVYLGSAYAVFHQDDITIDLADTFIDAKFKNTERAKYILEKLSILVTVVLLTIISMIYWKFLLGKVHRMEHSSTMRINMLIPVSGCMVGFILMLFHAVSLLIIPKSVRD